MAGRRGAVVEDDFYNKLEKLNVQAGKRDKFLFAHVQLICEAHDTVMRSYYQQVQNLHTIFGDFWVLARILKNCTYTPGVYIHFSTKKSALPGAIAFHSSVCKRHSEDSGRLGLTRRRRWRTLENKCMCK